MTKRHFMDLYRERAAEGKVVCVGLDLHLDLFPEFLRHRKASTDVRLIDYAQSIVEKTHDIVLAYKANIAFYEGYGSAGMVALAQIIAFIHEVAPGVPVILDAKRADIGNTNLGYVHAAFDLLRADAITVNPYFGQEALQPFLDRDEKGIIILCRTSNNGAGEFQDPQVVLTDPIEAATLTNLPGAAQYVLSGGARLPVAPMYQRVAYRVARHWNGRGNCALVVGATYPKELQQVRQITDIPFLIPGIGAQGGDVEATVRNGRDSSGQGMIINSSRGIIYAADPRAEALHLDGLIRQFATA